MAISGLTNSTTQSTLGNALTGNTSSNASTDLGNAIAGTNQSGSNSATNAIGDSTSDALQQISDAIAAIGAQASGEVQEFERTAQDVLYDNNATARQIGQLRLNTTRLNVISAMSGQDKVDTFSFNATSGSTKLNLIVNDPNATDQTKDASGNLRIQIFAKGKGLVADSDSGAGDAYKNYQALKNGQFDLAAGGYTIRVTRAQDVDTQAKNTYNYAIQLSQGTKYTQDYTTTEQGYTPGTDDPFGLSGGGSDSPLSILSDSLADAYSNINSLPAIGTSGTSKLLGMIYTGSF
ncbi:MAG TPA: hypothetical protein VHK68_03845 [Gemmatimonadales bacterium]|jgi:hypothetical protein|nr:hypothetical protein [Gemmatimonadales bacterium]